MGTDLPLARSAWRQHGKYGYDGDTMEDTPRQARHEVMREQAKTVGSEEKGHAKEMPVKGSQRSTSYTVQKYPWCE